MEAREAELALAMAALNPEAAIAAAPHVSAALETEELVGPPPSVAGVPAPERRLPAIAFAVEVDEPPPMKRWRFFIFYCLIRLAALVYPFKFELYRTSHPWED